MSARTATNIAVIIAVAAIVAGAAWYKSQRASAPEPGAEEPVAARAEQPASQSAVDAVDAQGAPATTQPAAASATAKLPRLVDLGADECVACKKLAPILDALRKEYEGRLAVEFIDVWKNPPAKALYGIRLIPTQILYDKDGRELWRHEGFISREELTAIFADKVGVK